MNKELRAYTISSIVYMLCSAILILLAWIKIPIQGDFWLSVVSFAIFATIAELLAINIGDGTNVDVTPTAPVYWAATCVLGPIPSAIVCVLSCAFSDVFAMFSYSAINGWAKPFNSKPDEMKNINLREIKSAGLFMRPLYMAATMWQPRAQITFRTYLSYYVRYISTLILTVVPAGMVYYYLGGRFLISVGTEESLLTNLALPFLGLIVVSAFVEMTIYVTDMAILYPIQGARGIYGVLLGIKLTLIERGLPVCRAELLLVIVALLLAYLYYHIGILGFVLAAMPVFALRDFFYNWIEERNAYLDTITTLATYMQHYHPYTRGHLKRVADMSARLARELQLPAESIRHISHAGFLHDIGKIGVSEEILDKTSKLENEEWEKIKEHPIKGAEIISHLDFLENTVDWIKYHHKWYNGQGYPADNGNGSGIPIEASIIAVADSFDAMTDDRELAMHWKCDSCGYEPEDDQRPAVCPKCGAQKRRIYREPKTLDQAIDELRRGSGTQFHPRVVKAFLAMVERDGIHLNG